jgi:uracil-DNA glycosylase
VYRLLHELGLMARPKFKPDGHDDSPPKGNYAITNAVDQMPWNEASSAFRSPSHQEVIDQAPRLARDVKESGAEVILALGGAATRALGLAMECEPFMRGMPQKAAVQHCIDYAGVPLANGCVAFATFHPSYSYWKRFPELHGKIVLQIKHRIR